MGRATTTTTITTKNNIPYTHDLLIITYVVLYLLMYIVRVSIVSRKFCCFVVKHGLLLTLSLVSLVNDETTRHVFGLILLYC